MMSCWVEAEDYFGLRWFFDAPALRADRPATPAHRKTTGDQSNPLPPPSRTSFRPGWSARSQLKTRPPLFQSPKIIRPVLLTTKKSCFENCATKAQARLDTRPL